MPRQREFRANPMKLATVLLVTLLLAPAALADAGRTESQEYVSRGVVGTARCGGSGPVAEGGACFVVRGGETTLDLVIRDEAVPTVTGAYAFRLADGTLTRAQEFCGAVSGVSIPAGADRVLVFAPGSGETPADCGAPVKFAPKGTITATFL